MLRRALFNIIRQEAVEIEDELHREERLPAPDVSRLSALRKQAVNLRRELEHFPEAG